MLFTNPNIILDIDDMLIGSVEVKNDEINFLNYLLLVENNILKQVIQYVKEDVIYTGVSREQSCENTKGLVRSMLTFPPRDKAESNVCDEETITKEIMDSYEFKNWKNKIYYRFMDMHIGVITKETPIKVSGKKRVEFEDAELKTSFEEKPLYTILDALISANTNE
jgi:hypothetical protein